MFADFSDLTTHERYKLLIATVMPRPIALVTTLSKEGVLNAAPFSFFNIFSEDPALAVLGLEARRDNDGLKDRPSKIPPKRKLAFKMGALVIPVPMGACPTNLDP